jgi:hypothetical protein
MLDAYLLRLDDNSVIITSVGHVCPVHDPTHIDVSPTRPGVCGVRYTRDTHLNNNLAVLPTYQGRLHYDASQARLALKPGDDRATL